MKDEYVSVEHVLLAMPRPPSSAGRLLADPGVTPERLLEVLTEVRGNQRVTSANPEATTRRSRNTAATWSKWPAAASSTRSSAATRRSAG